MLLKPDSIWLFRAAAVQWLRYERQCPLVAIERGISCGGVPDVIGMTGNRFITEIEIKRTVQDFKNNAKKLAEFNRERSIFVNTGWERARPRLFYFLVPAELVEKVRPLLQQGQGLMALYLSCERGLKFYRGVPYPKVIQNALPDNRAKPLTIRQCVQMAKHQSGTVSSLLTEVAKRAR